MLRSLVIRNFVLIDNLDIQFDKGLSVITGETGAGKSIILGALSLVLGQRADGKSIRQGVEKCVIEAEFDIAAYQLSPFFQENDLEYDEESCILRRELFSSGKSRAFVNDSPVSLTLIKELGNQLIDIHSQHQNLLLNDSHFQLKVVDLMAQNQELLTTYQQQYTAFQALKREINSLQERSALSRQEEDYLRFQLEQFQEVQLKKGEQELLEEEQEILSHAEEIKGGLYKIAGLLNGDDQGSILSLKEALTISTSLERYYPRAKEIKERLQTAYIDLNDLASETETLQDAVDFNPERLEWVNDRLHIIYSLQQKHHVSTVDDLLALQQEFEVKLEAIDSFDEQLTVLNKQLENCFNELKKDAVLLNRQRQKASKDISKELVEMVSQLGMPHARFHIEITPKEEPGAYGMDDIRFLFSANKNGELQPVAQTASGGEISRLMLCIKTMIAGFTALPTIIFDEVDTGVSGDIADKMGDIMQQLGKKMQVITISHLPQIAAKGKEHYLVYKEDTPERTITQIKQLEQDERIREIARMLSGATLTEASIANAKELLRWNN